MNEIPSAPVHINIPLRQPLYGVSELTTKPEFKLSQKKNFSLTSEEKETVKNVWRKSKKKLILIGQLSPDPKLEIALSTILTQPDVAVLVENTSNLQNFQKIVHCIDRTLAVIKEDELEQFAPDLLIAIGGAIISKKIKAFFRTKKPLINWRVGNYLFEEDTYQSLTHSFEISAAEFFDFIAFYIVVYL